MTDDGARTGELYTYLVGALAKANQDGHSRVSKMFGSTRTFYDKLRQAEKAITTGELAERLAGLKKYLQDAGQKAARDNKPFPPVLTARDIRLAFLKLIELTPEECQSLGLSQGDEDIIMQQALLQLWSNQNRQDYEQVLRFYNAALGDIHSADTPLDNYSEETLHETIQEMVRDYLNTTSPSLQMDNGTTTEMDQVIVQYQLVDLVVREFNQIVLKAGVQQVQLAPVEGRESYCQRYLQRNFLRRLVKSVVDNQLLNHEFPVFIHSVSIDKCGPFPLMVSQTSENLQQRPDSDKSDLIHNASLNHDLLGLHQYERSQNLLDEDTPDCAEIASQNTYQIKVEFYMKVRPQDLERNFPEAYEQLRRESADGHDQIFFTLDSTGVGGVMSHMTKLVNNALLTDICVPQDRKQGLTINLRRDYFPIAHDVMLKQHSPRSNVSAPVWAHNLAMLCKNQDLAKAMDQSRRGGHMVSYANVSFGNRVGWGDYCGFDVLLCEAKAALNARLRAIKHTGVGAHDYLQAMYNRVEGEFFIQQASILVRSYPFSSFAQENLLRQTVLRDMVVAPPGTPPYLTEEHPYTLYIACLHIAENFLIEGAYRKAWPYIHAMSDVLCRTTDWYDYFNSPQRNIREFQVFSGSLIVRFTLCIAYYFLLVDPDQEATTIDSTGHSLWLPRMILWENPGQAVHWYSDPERLRNSLIERSWEALEAAEKHLYVRLAKYFVISEESQGTFHPHYKYLSQIYFLRAKLFLYFADYLPVNPAFYQPPTDRADKPSTRSSQVVYSNLLYLFEKARLHAGADGDSLRYTCYTAYQSWVYAMAACLPQGVCLMTNSEIRHADLSRQDCLQWARRLRDDALSSYDTIGRHCYLKVKEKSGVSDSLLQKRHGDRSQIGTLPVEAIPAIRETFRENDGSRVVTDGNTRILELDMSMLAVDKELLGLPAKEDDSGVIYLFGPNACYLFFARGLCHLASDSRNEFVDTRGNAAQTKAHWLTKFDETYKLFSYAWAIADDGAEVEPLPASDPEEQRQFVQLRVTRTFDSPHECLDDVTAMQALYPFRVTEIAGLGRIFAAACALLCLRLESNQAKQTRLQREIEGLLSDLHQTEQCAKLNAMKASNHNAGLLNDQTRYNGHLASIFSRCQSILQAQLEEFRRGHSPKQTQISDLRNTLLRELFGSLRQ